MAVYARADADFTLPTKNAIKASQPQMAPEDEQNDTMPMMFGTLELHFESLYRVLRKRRHVPWILKEDKRQK